MPERIVTVHRFEQLWRDPPAGDGAPVRAGYEIECSSGTYVRSLIADLGDAYCEELRRTAIGPFVVADAVAPPPRGHDWSDPPLLERRAGAERRERPREPRLAADLDARASRDIGSPPCRSLGCPT